MPSILALNMAALGISFAQEKAIACTLDAGDFKERTASIRDLARRSLRHASRTPLMLSLTYGPEALDEVGDLVAKEKTCCAFLTFDLTNNTRDVILTTTATQAAAEAADLLFDHLAPELLRGPLRASPCHPSRVPSVKFSPLAGTAAAVRQVPNDPAGWGDIAFYHQSRGG